ncbi:hypothetical protein ACLB2K_026616 [Fragaria x ananassa]
MPGNGAEILVIDLGIMEVNMCMGSFRKVSVGGDYIQLVNSSVAVTALGDHGAGGCCSAGVVEGSEVSGEAGLRDGGRKIQGRANHFLVQVADRDLHRYDVTINPEVTSKKIPQRGDKPTGSSVFRDAFRQENEEPLYSRAIAIFNFQKGEMIRKKSNNRDDRESLIRREFGLQVREEMALVKAPVLPSPLSSHPGQIEKVLRDIHKMSVQKGRQLQLLIVILPDFSDSSYGKIKRTCETELGIVSQCCEPKKVKTFNTQYLESLALKINVKVGGRNTVLNDAICKKLPVVTDGVPTIIFGADVTHPAAGDDSSPSVAAVVGSTDWPEVTNYRAIVSAQPHRDEIIKDLYKSHKSEKDLVPGGMIRYARCTRSVSIVPPVYYPHLVAFRARHYIDSDSSDGGSIAGVGAHVLRALPEIKGNAKEVMFYC